MLWNLKFRKQTLLNSWNECVCVRVNWPFWFEPRICLLHAWSGRFQSTFTSLSSESHPTNNHQITTAATTSSAAAHGGRRLSPTTPQVLLTSRKLALKPSSSLALASFFFFVLSFLYGFLLLLRLILEFFNFSWVYIFYCEGFVFISFFDWL